MNCKRSSARLESRKKLRNKIFEWSKEWQSRFTAFTKGEQLQEVEYLKRTNRNLIKRIRCWRSTTGMRELFYYYILLRSWKIFVDSKCGSWTKSQTYVYIYTTK